MSFSDDGYDQHACKLVGSAQSNLDIELGELRRRPMGKGGRFIFPTLVLASAYISHFYCIPLPILPTLNHVKRIVQ